MNYARCEVSQQESSHTGNADQCRDFSQRKMAEKGAANSWVFGLDPTKDLMKRA